MTKSGFDFSGFEEFGKQLDELSKTVEDNAMSTDGELSIETDLILENVDSFNKRFGSVFTNNSSDQEYLDFFGNAYQDVISEGIFEKNYDTKQVFNSRFNPYAKVE